jgi:hypothetical protein
VDRASLRRVGLFQLDIKATVCAPVRSEQVDPGWIWPLPILEIGVSRQLHRPAFHDEIIGVHALQPGCRAQVQIEDRGWPDFACPPQAFPKRRNGFQRVARWSGDEGLLHLVLLLIGDGPYHGIGKRAAVAGARQQGFPLIPRAVLWLMMDNADRDR